MSTELSEKDNAILDCIFNPNTPLSNEANSTNVLKDVEDSSTEIEESRKLELRAIQLAENGALNDALSCINSAIEISPQRPSLFNNRAHIHQYMRKFEDAFCDVTKAINLCNSQHERTLSLAHCQRGILHKRSERLELAAADFEVAATMGNKFAKGQLVEMNPYAALCNHMLRQVMDTMK